MRNGYGEVVGWLGVWGGVVGCPGGFIWDNGLGGELCGWGIRGDGCGGCGGDMVWGGVRGMSGTW